MFVRKGTEQNFPEDHRTIPGEFCLCIFCFVHCFFFLLSILGHCPQLKQGSNHFQTLLSRKCPFSNKTNPHLQIHVPVIDATGELAPRLGLSWERWWFFVACGCVWCLESPAAQSSNKQLKCHARVRTTIRDSSFVFCSSNQHL